MNYSLYFLKGGDIEDYIGVIQGGSRSLDPEPLALALNRIEVIKGHTRSLDYGSYDTLNPKP